MIAALVVAFMGFFLVRPGFASDQASVAQINKSKVQKALNAWMEGTGTITDLFSNDIRWTIVGNCLVSGTIDGKHALVDKLLKSFGARFAN